MSNRDVEAEDIFALLVDDRIEGDSGLTSLAVANDELALSTSDCEHRIDRLDTGVHRFFDWLAINNTRGLDF